MLNDEKQIVITNTLTAGAAKIVTNDYNLDTLTQTYVLDSGAPEFTGAAYIATGTQIMNFKFL